MRSCCITPNFHTISEIWVYKRIVQVPEAFFVKKLLHRSHSFSEESSVFSVSIRSSRLWPWATTHVLSAYNILNRRSETLHMSFTYIIKSNGPSSSSSHSLDYTDKPAC